MTSDQRVNSEFQGRVQGQRPGFTALPNWIAGRATAKEIVVLWGLQYHYPEIRPSVKRLARLIGLSVSTVRRTLSDLEQKGWLTRVARMADDGDRDSNLYELRIWNYEAPGHVGGGASTQTPPPESRDAGVVSHRQHPRSEGQEGGVTVTEEEDELKNQEPPVSPSGGKANGQAGSQSVPRSRVRTAPLRIQPSDLPETLAPVAERLCYWWDKAKAGERSPRSLKLLLTSLEKIRAEGGIEAVAQQIETAIAAKEEVGKGWQSIAYSNWVRFRPRSEAQKAQEQALAAKPSHEQQEALELAQSRPELFQRAWFSDRGMAYVRFTDEAHAAASALKGEVYPWASAAGTVEALRFEIAFLERALAQASNDQGLDSCVCPF